MRVKEKDDTRGSRSRGALSSACRILFITNIIVLQQTEDMVMAVTRHHGVRDRQRKIILLIEGSISTQFDVDTWDSYSTSHDGSRVYEAAGSYRDERMWWILKRRRPREQEMFAECSFGPGSPGSWRFLYWYPEWKLEPQLSC